MNLKKTLLVISLLLSVSFAYSQGTWIDVEITNNVPATYNIEIILHQSSAQPSQGSLNYNISPNNTDLNELVFDDTDICIDEIKCTYVDFNDECLCPETATLNVNCYQF